MYVNPCWLSNTGKTMCRFPLENALMSSSLLLQQCFACLIHLLGWFVRREASGCTAAVLSRAIFSIYSKQQFAFLRSSHLALYQCISFASQWCIHTLVLIWPKFERNPISFYQRDQIFMWLQRQMLTSLSGTEILLLRSVKNSTNCKGLQLEVKIIPSWLKLISSVLFVFTNASWCLL